MILMVSFPSNIAVQEDYDVRLYLEIERSHEIQL